MRILVEITGVWAFLRDLSSVNLLLNQKALCLYMATAGEKAKTFARLAGNFWLSWTLGELQATGVDFSVFPMPSAARQATVVGGENLFLFKTNPERERAAFTFAEYVMGEEFQTQWAIGTGYLPVNLKARQSDAYQAFVAQKPMVKVFLEQAEFARSRPLLKGYPRISENLGRAIEAVLLGKNSPQEVLEKAQRRLDLIFR